MAQTRLATLLLAAWLLTGCGAPSAPPPPPAALTGDAMGHYCGMQVSQHAGPKGQIFLSDRAEPIWFSSVGDTLAYTFLPEEPRNILAIYVNDMGSADWDSPGDDSWIDARRAWYVIGSRRSGGMGAPEAVPFSRREDAASFAAEYGGRVLFYDQLPSDWLLKAETAGISDG